MKKLLASFILGLGLLTMQYKRRLNYIECRQ